ncbi:MAG: nucleotidyltransferase domain-containing protein [Thermoguttaceae bacterium]|nr:nucleotidyltransferase domain-containing protein [Thermoguttaceae bacterium]
MLFDELAEAELDANLHPDVLRLLDLKKNAPEVKKIPPVAAINQYLEAEIERILELISQLPNEANPGWAPLDEAFLAEISKRA